MTRRLLVFTALQFRRAARAFFFVLLVTLLLSLCIAGIAFAAAGSSSDDNSISRVNLGIVGSTTDSYLGFGIYAMQNMDSSRFTLNLITYDTEDEARAAFSSGEITAYLLLPDRFIDSIIDGTNTPVKFVSGTSQGGLGLSLVKELASSVSDCVIESETGVYTMQEVWLKEGLTDTLAEDAQTLNLEYFDLILNRTSMFDVKTLDGFGGISAGAYYLCAALLLLLLLWGMGAAHLFIRSDLSLEKVLVSSGVPLPLQLLGSYLAVLVLMLSSCLVIGGAAAAVFALVPDAAGILPEIGTAGGMLLFLLRAIPVCLCISAAAFFLYSLTGNLIGGMMLLFTCGIGSAFLAGCFYPLSYFPPAIRVFSSFLPATACLNYLTDTLCSGAPGARIFMLFAWMAVFLVLSALIFKIRIRRDS